MATLALAPYHDGPRAHYVSNVDGAHMHDTLKGLDPETTLFIVASKTFTTVETMTNAADGAALDRRQARRRCGRSTISPPSRPRSTRWRPSASRQDRVFGFWDWVGGRYSLWGAIGLPIMIAVGAEEFPRFPRRRA